MVLEITPQTVDVESLVTKVFLKCIELVGGFKRLAAHRTLTWLPSIARASLAIVLREEFNKTEDEIAEELGTTRQTVRQMLRANPDIALKRIETSDKELKTHVAGGLAKKAYELVKVEGDIELLKESRMEVPWAYLVLKYIKERAIKFPIESPDDLTGKLDGINIDGKDAGSLIFNLSYPIRTPAGLLKELKIASKGG